MDETFKNVVNLQTYRVLDRSTRYDSRDAKRTSSWQRGDTPTAVLDTLKQIGSACATCQQLHTPLFCFRVSLPDDALRFYAEVAIYPVWRDRRPVHDIVDFHTCFQNAAFFEDKSAGGSGSSLFKFGRRCTMGFPTYFE